MLSLLGTYLFLAGLLMGLIWVGVGIIRMFRTLTDWHQKVGLVALVTLSIASSILMLSSVREDIKNVSGNHTAMKSGR